jgi:hypothetical protein
MRPVATRPLVAAACPVCAHTVAATFFEGGDQPLATLGWPKSAQEAQAMPRLAHDWVQCPACSHVWNRSFTYDDVPYQKNPNRMFNAGTIWKGHLAESGALLAHRLPPRPTVVEIGCGEAHFLRGLAEGRFIGFDPNVTPETGRGVEFHARLFEPLVDLPAFAPDGVVIRHVVEHLEQPAALLEQLAWAASRLDKTCWLFVEAPCIDRVFDTDRLADFFYEHVSHFTTQSFRTLMERAGSLTELSHGYDGEVVYALVELGIPAKLQARANAAEAFNARAEDHRRAIRTQVNALSAAGAKVAIWGGTGKGAAFIHQFGLDAERFPLVVDSDPDKAGTHVPGTGQEIQFRDVLKTLPPGVVIIPTQWRAKDIVAEMAREGIEATTILIEHQGLLIDFLNDEHIYR